MKIEKLSLNKIRVTVTTGELNVWNINPNEISPDLPQLKDFIASMLEESYDGLDESILSSSILVEARPQGEDFVFVITRINGDSENVKKEIRRTAVRQKLASGMYKTKVLGDSSCIYFQLGSLEEFAEMIKAVGSESLWGTELYKDDKKLYIKVKRLNPDFKRVCMILTEYAKRLGGGSAVEAYIGEHTRLFAEYKDYDAISRCY